jgi:hypothetical protein
VIICSGILYGYYHIVLRNKKFHLYNRYYLLIASVISIIIPFLNIPVHFAWHEEPSVISRTLAVISSGNPGSIHIPYDKTLDTTFFSPENIYKLLYLLVASFFFIRFISGILYIRKLLRKNTVEKIDQVRFINTEEPGTPFSFFKWLFWNKKIDLRSENGEQIFRHELFHIRQKHSRDVIFAEVLTLVFWINPFFHLLKKEIRAIHEFLADEFATKKNDRWSYAELLVMQLLGSSHNHLVNPFFHNQLKRRIAMITSSKKPGYQFFRKLMVLPIITLVFALFAFKIKNYSTKAIVPETIGKNVTAEKKFSGSEKIRVADTSKPKGKPQQPKQNEYKKDNELKKGEAEMMEKEFKKMMEEKQHEAEKAQEEFKQMMMMKQQEMEKAQMEFKKMLETRQDQARLEGQEKFKQLMTEKQHEAEKMQQDFRQMMMMKQQEMEKTQMEFKKMMEDRQAEAGMEGQEKFKQLMTEKQREAGKMQEDFKQMMMMKQQEMEKAQAEFRDLMEKKHREFEMSQEEFKKMMLLKQQEAEKGKKEKKDKQ